MTNSEARRADEIIDALLDDLDQDRLARKIDRPIDTAASGFLPKRSAVTNQDELLDAAGAFVRHVYARGLGFSRLLTEEQGRAEALSLLEHAAGFDAVLGDALEADIHGVLDLLAAAIKLRERANLFRWVLQVHLGRCSWSLQFAIASRLHERLKPLLPPRVQACEPLRLVNQIPTLLDLELSGRRFAQPGVVGDKCFSVGSETT